VRIPADYVDVVMVEMVVQRFREWKREAARVPGLVPAAEHGE
jgi:hypothetical protein